MKKIISIFLCILLMSIMITNKGLTTEMNEKEKVEKLAISFIEETYNAPFPFDYEQVMNKYLKEGNDIFNTEMKIRVIDINQRLKADEEDGTIVKERFFKIGNIESEKTDNIYRVDLKDIDRTYIYDRGDIKNDHDMSPIYDATLYIEIDDGEAHVIDLYSDDNISLVLGKCDRIEELGYKPYTDEKIDLTSDNYEREISNLDISNRFDAEKKIDAILKLEQELLGTRID